MGFASSVFSRRLLIRVPALCAGLLILTSAAGCGGSSPSRTDAAPSVAPSATVSSGPPSAGAHCAAQLSGGTQVRFPTAGGTSLAGVVLGTGRTAVALFHTTQADVCQFASYAGELTAGGYQVLLVDFTGDGVSDRGTATPADDVVAAAAFLRGRGVSRLALIGASKGAIAVVGAAPLVQPPPLAVVSLSPPVRFQGVDGLAAAPRITVPVLYAAATGDKQFPADTKQLHDATPPASGRQLLLVDGGAHGNVMLRSVPAVRQAVDAFLAAHAPT